MNAKGTFVDEHTVKAVTAKGKEVCTMYNDMLYTELTRKYI